MAKDLSNTKPLQTNSPLSKPAAEPSSDTATMDGISGINGSVPGTFKSEEIKQEVKQTAKADDLQPPAYRTTNRGSSVISLITQGDKRIFAQFRNTFLVNDTPEILAALKKKHEEYEAKNTPIKLRGFLTQHLFELQTSPDKSYFRYKDKMIHSKEIEQAIDFAVEKGFRFSDKEYIVVNQMTYSKGVFTSESISKG